MAILLESARLVLREFTPADVDLLVGLDADPRVMHFITGGRPTPREEVEEEILPRWLRYYAESPGLGFWAAQDKAGEFLGWFHFRPGDGHGDDEPELGYRLRHEAAEPDGDQPAGQQQRPPHGDHLPAAIAHHPGCPLSGTRTRV